MMCLSFCRLTRYEKGKGKYGWCLSRLEDKNNDPSFQIRFYFLSTSHISLPILHTRASHHRAPNARGTSGAFAAVKARLVLRHRSEVRESTR